MAFDISRPVKHSKTGVYDFLQITGFTAPAVQHDTDRLSDEYGYVAP